MLCVGKFPEENKPGYAVYSRRTLALYDALVLGFSNRFIWRCPSRHLIGHHEANLSARHLDIGVGTGFFLDKARFPAKSPQITLLDPNRECLESASERISRYKPKSVHADALVPLPGALGRFDSIGLNYLLHCLPGSMARKSVVFDHLKPHLSEGGTVFGSTILQVANPRPLLARKLMSIYNARGVFANADDTLEALRAELSARFAEVSIEMIGCVALFTARFAKT